MLLTQSKLLGLGKALKIVLSPQIYGELLQGNCFLEMFGHLMPECATCCTEMEPWHQPDVSDFRGVGVSKE